MTDEAHAQSLIRLAAPAAGYWLHRNNVGALKDERGRVVRYGLANDSKALNEEIKSGDLIGGRRLLITPEWVGHHVLQFVSIECKREGWTWRGDAHERGQQRWADAVNQWGGLAFFATGPDDLRR